MLLYETLGPAKHTGVTKSAFTQLLGLIKGVTSSQLLLYPRCDGDWKGVAMHGNAYNCGTCFAEFSAY
jgi:hypothetical protein